jgi:hypothetical protein
MVTVELRGVAEAILGRGSFELQRSGPYEIKGIVQEVATSSSELRGTLLNEAGEPRDSLKVLIGSRVPDWSESLDSGTVKIIATMPCDG